MITIHPLPSVNVSYFSGNYQERILVEMEEEIFDHPFEVAIAFEMNTQPLEPSLHIEWPVTEPNNVSQVEKEIYETILSECSDCPGSNASPSEG